MEKCHCLKLQKSLLGGLHDLASPVFRDAKAELQTALNSWARVVGSSFMDQTHWLWIPDSDSQEMRLYHHTCS